MAIISRRKFYVVEAMYSTPTAGPYIVGWMPVLDSSSEANRLGALIGASVLELQDAEGTAVDPSVLIH